MAKLLHPLLMVLARATDRELARMVDYLKAENEILRARLPKRIVTTPAERARLVKVGKPLGTAIKELITIVTPRTFARWLAAEKPKKRPANPRKPGRPTTPEAIRELVVQMAKEKRPPFAGRPRARLRGRMPDTRAHRSTATRTSRSRSSGTLQGDP
jgi:hypothetical protein